MDEDFVFIRNRKKECLFEMGGIDKKTFLLGMVTPF